MIQTSIVDGVAVLSIDMPGRSMNVLTPELASALRAAFELAVADAAVHGIVICSGKSSFIAGADLAQMAPLAAASTSEAEARAAIADYSQLFRRIETAGKPVVGVASGTALGGGLELLLATHHRIASEDAGARYGLPEVTLGLLPGAGGTQRLPRLIGLQPSLPLLLEGRPLEVRRAQALGIFDAVVPAGELLDAARAALAAGAVAARARWDQAGFELPGLAIDSEQTRAALRAAREQVLARTHGNQPAPLAILDALQRGLGLPLDEALQVELDAFMPLLRGPVSQNMIRTGFFARQAADKLARRPSQPARRKLARLGIVGNKALACDLAQSAALADIDVVLLAPDGLSATKTRRRIADGLQNELQKTRLTQAQVEQALSRIRVQTSTQVLVGCELVIDTESEHFGALASLAATLPADCVLAVTGAALSLHAISAAAAHPQRLIGMHLGLPFARSGLIEVSAAPGSGDAAIALAMDFARQLRKTPVRIGDGAYVARGLQAYRDEGLRLLAEGVDAAMIERAATQLGMATSPLAVTASPDGIVSFTENATTEEVDEASIQQRLLYAQLLAAAGCWFDGVVSDADDLDLAAHLGWGFPIHLGGPAAAIDQIGIEGFVATLDALAAKHGPRFTPSPALREAASAGFRFRA